MASLYTEYRDTARNLSGINTGSEVTQYGRYWSWSVLTLSSQSQAMHHLCASLYSAISSAMPASLLLTVSYRIY